MGVLAADSDGCCVVHAVMSRRLFSYSFNLDISSVVESQAGGGL